MKQLIAEQIGKPKLFYIAVTMQTIAYAVICGILGYLLSEKVGLMKSFRIKKDAFIKAVLTGAACGAVFSADYWVFGRFHPEIVDTYQNISAANLIASVLYGGIIEEVMLRLFIMSLLVLVLKVLLCKDKTEQTPHRIFVIANILSAVLFAAGYLPATFAAFENVTAAVICRCFVLNGGLGIVFGQLYHRYGIQYAMLDHMGCHIISKLIWTLFI